MAILEITNLHKRYGSIQAVTDLSLSVEKGNVYGILGPNGSGKTTTLGVILGIIRADSGQFSWFDGAYGKNERMHIGALLETPNFYPYLSAQRNLEIVAHIKKIKTPPYDNVLKTVNLLERKHSAFSTFSFGMKQRLAIAAAMLSDPEVLIFDEPTNGLDPQGIADTRDIIRRIAAEGKTIVMASHILDEVEKVCSHVAIIRKGKLLATGEIGSILNSDQQMDIGSDDLTRLREFLAGIPGVQKLTDKGKFLTLYVKENLSAAELNRLAFQSGITLDYLVMRPKSLESEFLEIISK